MNREHLQRNTILLLLVLAFAVTALVRCGLTARADAPGGITPALGKTGELRIIGPKGQVGGACPLKHTSVVADVPGTCARVKVTQEFVNPTSDKIEAVYVFPLPNEAAVDWMEMQVGKRTIRAEIKEREEAKKIYEQAKEQGHVTALLDQERPNIFTQSVANIEPGEKVTVTISYLQILDYEDGYYEFVFPMVVGPRYMPGNPTGMSGTGWAPDTDQVPDASKISPPVTPPGTRAGHDISVEVRIDAGTPISDVTSKQHQIDVEREGKSGAVVRLRQNDAVPNKDFILRYSAGGKQIQTGLLTHTRAKGDGFFTLIVQPPPKPQASQIIPKEMIFVIDCSGSMMGEPIEKAKETMDLCIRQMNPEDTFQLICFANDTAKLFDSPQPNTPDNQLMGLTFLRDRMGSGGTEMMKPVKEVLNLPNDPNRLRIVCFMTDGYVGNDMEILNAIKQDIGRARIFAFGVGTSVNRYLLDNMAKIGRGAVDYVTLGSSGREAANRFHDRIGNPLLTDIGIDWGGLAVTQIYPEIPSDLFSGKPLIIKGRYTKPGSAKVTISGRHGNEMWRQTIDAVLPASESGHAALPALWAREHINQLMEEDLFGIQQGKPDPVIKTSIIKTALEFRLMSQYTSFVAVEDKIVTQGGKPVKVTVPVEMPQGVSYDRVFGIPEEAAGGARVAKALMRSHGTRPASSAGVYSLATPSPSSGFAAGHAYYGYSDMASSAGARLDPELQKLMEVWAKDGRAPQDCRAKIEGGKAQVMIWASAVTPENLKKLKNLGCEIKTSSSASKAILAWAPISKLEEVSKLGFVQQVRIPEYGGGKTAR